MAMNMLFVSSSYFLRNIPVAILNKREIIKLKMQRYKDVKVYLYSFILPDYMTDKYVSEQLDALASHLLFPHLILSIANTTIYNPRLVFNKVEGGIIHIVLCFEHEPRQCKEVGSALANSEHYRLPQLTINEFPNEEG